MATRRAGRVAADPVDQAEDQTQIQDQGNVDPDPNEGQADQGGDPQDDQQHGGDSEGSQPGGDVRVALKQEREAKRKLAQQVLEREIYYKQREAVLQDRLAQITQAWQARQQGASQGQPQQGQPEPKVPDQTKRGPQIPNIPVPDLMSNPVGHVAAMNKINEARWEAAEREREELRRQVAEAAQQAGGFMQFQQALVQQQQLVSSTQADEELFRQRVPDYDDAVDYLDEVWRRMLYAPNGGNPALINQSVQNMTQQLVVMARQQGRSPAEVAYEMAMHMGYQRGSGGQAQQGQGQQQGQNQAQRMAAIQRGQDVSRGTGAPASKQGSPFSSLDQLANMSNDEFAKAMEAIEGKNPNAFRTIMGG